jgi:hypothetical protein
MRGARGKYATALLVSALTGVRPHELTYGVEVWKEYDEASHRIVVCFAIHGAKVKANQGQPYRLITYAVNDSNPLVAAMAQHLDNHVEPKLIVQITNPGNLPWKFVDSGVSYGRCTNTRSLLIVFATNGAPT